MTRFFRNQDGEAVERRPAPPPVVPGPNRPPATRASTDGCDGRRGRPLHTKAGCALFSAVSRLGLRFRSPPGEGLALQGEAQSGRGSPLADDDYHKTSRTSPVSRPTWRDCPRGQPVVVVGGAGTPAGKPCASGNRVPCTAADRPLERRVLGQAGPIWNDRCPRVYHDRDAGRPSGSLTREILPAGRIFHLAPSTARALRGAEGC